MVHGRIVRGSRLHRHQTRHSCAFGLDAGVGEASLDSILVRGDHGEAVVPIGGLGRVRAGTAVTHSTYWQGVIGYRVVKRAVQCLAAPAAAKRKTDHACAMRSSISNSRGDVGHVTGTLVVEHLN